MNFRAGQIYVSYVFYRLYSNGNPIVVFIANTILYLSKVTGVTATMTALMEMCKKKVMEAIPAILTSAALNSFLTNTIVKALMDPTVLRNFVQSLSPELAGQLVQNALPALTQGVTQGLIEGATPAITQGLTRGLIEGLAPALTQGVIEGARPLLIEGIKEGATQGARLLVEQQAKTAVMSKIGDLALRFGVGAVAGYLGADAGTVGLLTNGPAGLLTNAGGGKKTKKIRRNKKSKHINKKKNKKTKTRKH